MFIFQNRNFIITDFPILGYLLTLNYQIIFEIYIIILSPVIRITVLTYSKKLPVLLSIYLKWDKAIFITITQIY